MSQGRVLVVEDDEETRKLVGAILGRAGFEVDAAPDGAAGLASLEGRAYSVILLDMVMPRMSGWAFLRRLAERPRIPPVIVLSARYSRPESLGALGGYIWTYVKKPFKAAVLVETCERVCQVSAGEASQANRRASPRFPTRVSVTVLGESGIPVAKGWATDISLTGAQVDVDAPLPRGTAVVLRLGAAEVEHFSMRGRVVWTAKQIAGVAFQGVTEEQADQIAQLLEQPPG